jgi:hypothetical protein
MKKQCCRPFAHPFTSRSILLLPLPRSWFKLSYVGHVKSIPDCGDYTFSNKDPAQQNEEHSTPIDEATLFLIKDSEKVITGLFAACELLPYVFPSYQIPRFDDVEFGFK